MPTIKTIADSKNLLKEMKIIKNFQPVENVFTAFKSKEVGSVLFNQKMNKYADVDEIKEKVMNKLNAEFNEGDDPLYMCESPSYTIMRCKYKECTF